MLQRLKWRFVMLYTITAGTIFLAMLVMLFVWNSNEQMQTEREKFQLKMDRVAFELQKSVMLNMPVFQTLEYKNHMMIYFEEQGKRLGYANNYGEEEERERLFAAVRDRAQQEHVLLSIDPKLSELVRSSVFQLSGIHGKKYLGQAMVIPNAKGWFGIILVQDVTGRDSGLKNREFVYGGAGILAILLLFAFSYYFVHKTMKPVEEAAVKQTEFVAAASHELKSPLAVIKTCASAVNPEDEQQKEFIHGIETECSRMSKLIEDLLLLASAETKTWKIRMEEFAVDEFLIQQYDHLALLLHNKNQELSLVLPDEMEILIRADRSRLLQVMTILIDNASSYAPENTRIEIDLVKEQKAILLKVADHGSGITDEEKAQIFDRFHRGDKSRNDKNHYGLGLSIAYELVRRMNGTIKVIDTSGGGATFIIEFAMSIMKEKRLQ